MVAVSANSWEPEMPCENINKWYEENRVHYGVLLFSSFCEVNVFMKVLCIIMKIKIPWLINSTVYRITLQLFETKKINTCGSHSQEYQMREKGILLSLRGGGRFIYVRTFFIRSLEPKRDFLKIWKSLECHHGHDPY